MGATTVSLALQIWISLFLSSSMWHMNILILHSHDACKQCYMFSVSHTYMYITQLLLFLLSLDLPDLFQSSNQESTPQSWPVTNYWLVYICLENTLSIWFFFLQVFFRSCKPWLMRSLPLNPYRLVIVWRLPWLQECNLKAQLPFWVQHCLPVVSLFYEWFQ